MAGPRHGLTVTETAVLDVLRRSAGRVVGRATINREAGLDHCTERRCDSAIVSLRKVLGPDSIITVRRRGWMLTGTGADRAGELFGPRPAGPDAPR
jgi:DNA-binding response OmpR family regulator